MTISLFRRAVVCAGIAALVLPAAAGAQQVKPVEVTNLPDPEEMDAQPESIADREPDARGVAVTTLRETCPATARPAIKRVIKPCTENATEGFPREDKPRRTIP